MLWLRRLSMLAAIAWMAVLFYLSSQPSLGMPGLFPGQDKLMHAVAYGILGGLILLALPPPATPPRYSWRQIQIATLLASAYGISDEIHQTFVPGRSAELADWFADTAGAFIAAWLIARVLNRWLQERLEVES